MAYFTRSLSCTQTKVVPFSLFVRIKMIANNTSLLPYQACLMPNVPEDIQHQVRNITILVIHPLSMLLGVLSFICNTLVVLTVARTPSLQHPSLLMLSSLSITDLLYSVFALLREIETVTNEHMCPGEISRETFAFALLCNLATLGNLAVVSRDRYMAVKKPWWYRNHVTKSRAIKIICITWLVSVVISFVVYLSEKMGDGYKAIGQIMSLLFYLICLFAIFFCYLSLYCNKTPTHEAPHVHAILEREKRLANTVGLIFLALLLTFLPALFIPIVLYAKGVTNFLPFRPYFAFLFQLNGCLSPLLNFGRTKEMRKALRDILECPQQVQPAAIGFALSTNGNRNQSHTLNEPGDIPLEQVSSG